MPVTIAWVVSITAAYWWQGWSSAGPSLRCLQKDSGRGHDLDVSLFERLVDEGYPYCALKQQHRMRTSIAGPVRTLTYPDLVDGPGTVDRESVRGLRRDLMFVDHQWPEGSQSNSAQSGGGRAKRRATSAAAGDEDSMSKVNAKEAEMAVCVLRYVLQQGYRARQVVMLTPYLGQMRVLMAAMNSAHVTEQVGERDGAELEAAGLAQEVRPRLCLSQRRP